MRVTVGGGAPTLPAAANNAKALANFRQVVGTPLRRRPQPKPSALHSGRERETDGDGEPKSQSPSLCGIRVGGTCLRPGRL